MKNIDIFINIKTRRKLHTIKSFKKNVQHRRFNRKNNNTSKITYKCGIQQKRLRLSDIHYVRKIMSNLYTSVYGGRQLSIIGRWCSIVYCARFRVMAKK